MDLAKRKNNFSGEKRFSVLAWLFSRPQKGVWGMNASGLPFSKNLRTFIRKYGKNKMGSLPCDSEPIECCSSCLLPREELASFPDIRIHRNVLLAERTSCLVPRVELHVHK